MEIKSVIIVVLALVDRSSKDIAYKYLDFETYRLVTPIDPATIAADLLSRGFDPLIFDLGTCKDDGINDLTLKLKEVKADAFVVANSILTFGSTFDNEGLNLFKVARVQNPAMIRILTGTYATNHPGKSVEEGVCDYSIKGEPELAVGELLTNLSMDQRKFDIEGLSYRKKDGTTFISNHSTQVDINKLPIPDYSLVEPSQKKVYFEYLEYGKIRYPEKSCKYRDIMTSRGCILDCSFCSVKHLRGGQIHKKKSVDKIIDEIKKSLDEGIEEIHFFDDLFVENEKQVLQFADTLMRENLKFPWFVAQGFPLWTLTEEGLHALRETGMYRLICPFESGDNKVLKKLVGKPTTREHHEKIVYWANQLGFEIIGLFVIGMPDETREQLIETVNFAEKHSEIDYAVFSIATPLIGTRMTKKAVEKGIYEDQGQLNKLIKRTVAMYHTDQFSEVELGLIRSYDWDRINFSTQERREKYAKMVGMDLKQVDLARKTSKEKFNYHFPDYEGPYSFREIFESGQRATIGSLNV